jgi:hypothetical protein
MAKVCALLKSLKKIDGVHRRLWSMDNPLRVDPKLLWWSLWGDFEGYQDSFVDTEPLSPLETVQKKHDLEEVLCHDDYRPIFSGPKLLPNLE